MEEVQLLNKPSDGDKEMNPGDQVFTMQPEVNVINTPQDKPLPDYLLYSIFTMLFCFLPTGIAALVFSITSGDDVRGRPEGYMVRLSPLVRKKSPKWPCRCSD
nr:uncharacterized protein LOC129448633 isoform X2 [Misgurnus anguillicaudatus]